MPLAASGRRVIAVDNAPAMLARAAALWSRATDRATGAQLDLIEADAVRLRLEERFGLVLVALNSLLLLDHDTQPELFATIARHLGPAAVPLSTFGSRRPRTWRCMTAGRFSTGYVTMTKRMSGWQRRVPLDMRMLGGSPT